MDTFRRTRGSEYQTADLSALWSHCILFTTVPISFVLSFNHGTLRYSVHVSQTCTSPQYHLSVLCMVCWSLLLCQTLMLSVCCCRSFCRCGKIVADFSVLLAGIDPSRFWVFQRFLYCSYLRICIWVFKLFIWAKFIPWFFAFSFLYLSMVVCL